MIKKISNFIVNKRYLLFGIFFVMLIFAFVGMRYTNVNYDLSNYLSNKTETKQALKIMEEEFSATSSVNIMFSKEEIAQHEDGLDGLVDKLSIDGVSMIMVNDQDSEEYYLITIMLNTGDYDKKSQETAKRIQEILKDYTFYISGASVNNVKLENSIAREVKIILLIAILIIFAVLLLTSHSWFEPVIFLIVIGVSILINMGTNFIFGSISYITQSVQAILQLALAMDYSIILLHSYDENLAKGYDDKKAINHALRRSIVSIFSSALTTIAGLSALMFMSFTIGFDIGMVLSKGILCSMLSVFLIMPGLLLLFRKPLLKLKHKSIPVNGTWINYIVHKGKMFISIGLILLIGVCFVLQQKNDYVFSYAVNTADSAKIVEVFGGSNQMVVIVPLAKTTEDYQKQIELKQSLMNLQIEDETFVKGVTTMADTQDGLLIQILTPQTFYEMIHSMNPEDQSLNQESIEALYDFFGFDKENEMLYNVVISLDDFLDMAEHTPLNPTQMAKALHLELSVSEMIGLRLIYGSDSTMTIFEFVEKIQQSSLFNSLDEQRKQLLIQMDQLFKNTDLITYFHQELAKPLKTGVYTFNSDKHSRMILSLKVTASQKEKNRKAIEMIKKEVTRIYGKQNYLAGNNMVSYDIENAFKGDLLKVNIITIVSIIVILLLTLKSLILPFILVFVIQGAIYISMAISYVSHSPIFFMSYLICICIQMGATIDYGIILTSKYLYSRKTKDKKESMQDAIKGALPTILSSGTILVLAGFIVGLVSSEMAISSIGILLGRGTIVSILMVLFLLPSLILLLDKPIMKTLFNKEKKKNCNSMQENI